MSKKCVNCGAEVPSNAGLRQNGCWVFCEKCLTDGQIPDPEKNLEEYNRFARSTFVRIEPKR